VPRVYGIDPGERDRAVLVQQRGEDAADSAGEPVETWTTLASNVFMRRIDTDGRERFQASQVSAPYDTRWEMPYRADMDPDLVDVPKLRRLSYKGRYYDIVHAALINRQDGIELSTLASGRAEA
jgi:SPP1 family predicted phage head-tail adaptor